jgi:hypothetical protein
MTTAVAVSSSFELRHCFGLRRSGLVIFRKPMSSPTGRSPVAVKSIQMSLRYLLLSLVLVLFWRAAPADADWIQRDSRTEPSIASGVVHQHLTVEDRGTGADATLELARFSPKSAGLHVIDNPHRRDLAEAMRGDSYVAGVNGGYFDENFTPLGLRIMNGRTLSTLRRGRLLSGVIVCSGATTRIFRLNEFTKGSQISTAIQCGPFLLDHGRPVPGLESQRSARRTYAATTSSEVILGFCTEVSLAKLSTILASLTGDLKIQRALNLDGGSSSAFWFRRKDGTTFTIPEQKSVRDFIAVAAR